MRSTGLRQCYAMRSTEEGYAGASWYWARRVQSAAVDLTRLRWSQTPIKRISPRLLCDRIAIQSTDSNTCYLNCNLNAMRCTTAGDSGPGYTAKSNTRKRIP
eukprot:3122493-Rhodomonas_salina.1